MYIWVIIGLCCLFNLFLFITSLRGVTYFYEIYQDKQDRKLLRFIIWCLFICTLILNSSVIYLLELL